MPAPESAQTTSATDDNDTIVIYAMPGSQFTFKVLAAFSSRSIPHYIEFVPVPLAQRRKVLPSGGTMVPEMQVGKGVVVPDSEAILHWLDEHRNTRFFPNEQASELSTRASTKTLAAMVYYYNWVNDDGYKASMQKSAVHMLKLGWMASVVRTWLIDRLLSSERKKFAQLAMKALKIEDESVLEDEGHMRQLLLDELAYFQSLLQKPADEQPYLLADSKEPSAADFSVYAQLERLVGAGTASDVKVYPSLQELKDKDTEGRFGRLWEWHDLMRERFPVQFKGKRVPNL